VLQIVPIDVLTRYFKSLEASLASLQVSAEHLARSDSQGINGDGEFESSFVDNE
jgi:hypothetical protein